MNTAHREEDPQYPLVSAIMLVGKCPLEDIKAAIKCFKSQTYPYKELIIINNAFSQYEASGLNIHAQHNIFIVDTAVHMTAGMARNHGIAAAKGQIIAQFDADYYHHPNRIEAQIGAIIQNEAQVCVLTETLNYSYVSGRASYNTNDRKAILSTMVMIRPAAIDYADVNKNEEKSILEKMTKAEMKIISLPRPDLACKLNITRNTRIDIVESCSVSKVHVKIIKDMLLERKSDNSTLVTQSKSVNV